jgi:Zn-dependent M28 family amino/carboxypeptidase
LGANDGVSGIALLLELGRVLKERGTDKKVVLMFFDAEDYGTRNAMNEYCMGSTYMAMRMPSGIVFERGINVDMIGDKDLLIKIESYSYKGARGFVEDVWLIGERRYPCHFSRERYPPILDDHVPFLRMGIPYINLIDFDYRYWHTHEDTSDKCSPRSLKVVGDVILEYIENWGGKGASEST